MAVGVALSGRGRRVAVQHQPHGLALLVGHDREVERDLRHVRQRTHGVGDPLLDLVAQRAAGDGERHLHGDVAAAHLHAAHHAEIDDGATQLGILHGAEGVDDLVLGGHGGLRMADGEGTGGRA